jgi:hypothetical protein
MKNFEDCSDGNWECYVKNYPLFKLVVSRHRRDDLLFKVYIQQDDDEILVLKNVHYVLIPKIENIFNLLI